MRQIKDVLRLKFEAALSNERIGAALRLSKGAVAKYLQRAAQAGLSWPLPPDMDDSALEALLFPKAPSSSSFAPADYGWVHQELKRKSVTLQLLWEEYRAAHPGRAYQYSNFCRQYHDFAATLKRSMRQIHRAGDKVFIDYSGQTQAIINAATGEISKAEIFIAVLGASNYVFAEATASQQLSDWIGSHVRMFRFFGACPALLVPDNLKSAITKPCRYEPEPNATYAAMARHYGVAILPARSKKPRDKAAVEFSVQLVQRWILARLRHRQFFSIPELNQTISGLLVDLNDRPFQKLQGSRSSAFASIDLPAMRPLPEQPYEFAEWKTATVNIDYHVDVSFHFYSVPHTLVGQEVEIRYTATGVECFFKGKRVAAHIRSWLPGKHTTLPEHMPESHRRHREWTPGRLVQWASTIGPATRAVVEWQFKNRPHPEQGYRSCLGLLSLARKYSQTRLEAACSRALNLGSPTRKSVLSILETKLDEQPDLFASTTLSTPAKADHANVRGAEYFRTNPNPTGESEPCSSTPPSIH